MMRRQRLISLATLLLAAVGLWACEGRTDKTDAGGVLLSVSDFDGLPIQVSVNAAVAAGGLVQVDQITIQNIAKDPTGTTSALMNVELQSYEVTFSRADGGTRLPPPLVRGIFGSAPVGGTDQLLNLPILTLDQLDNPPLSDLQFVNGGFDRETNSQVVTLRCRLVFFGKTLSGDDVATAPAFFSIDFTQ